MTNTFVVEKRALTRTHWIRTEPGPLAEGEVRMAIDAFALTSNNITYAAFGETMNYWSFFPTGDTATGCIPVWGFANVVESRCAGLAVGERFYGYLPMASEVVLQPVRVNDTGFSDGAEHRRELHAVYNQYVRCSTDPGHAPAREAEQALLRPLFTTSFLIDDFLADNAYFGAHTLVLSSASSKTAYGTAFCLARRHRDAAGGGAPAVRVVGLTSPGNIAFTQGLGCYDAVLTYDEVTRLSTESPSVYVDFSGSVEVRANVHRHLGHRLAYSGSVGGTHWAALGGAGWRQGAAGAAAGAVLRAGADQEAQRRLDPGGTAAAHRRGMDGVLAAGHRPATPVAAGGAWPRRGGGRGDLCGAAGRHRQPFARARARGVRAREETTPTVGRRSGIRW